MPVLFALALIFSVAVPTKSFATITVTNNWGGNFSNKQESAGKVVLYVGTAGGTPGLIKANCTSAANVTCNTCVDAPGETGGPSICNPRQVNPNTYLVITFQSDKVGGAPVLYQGTTALPTNPTLTSNSSGVGKPATIAVKWSDICEYTNTTTAVAGEAQCQVDGLIALSVGFDTDKLDFSVRVQYSSCQFADESGTTTGTTAPASGIASPSLTTGRTRNVSNYCNTGGGTTSANGDEGMYTFTAKPGDAKIYIKDLAAREGFPLVTNGVNIAGLRLYYTEIASTESCTVASRVRNSSQYFETTLTPKSTTDIKPDDDRVRGLENGHKYLFKMAMVDQANNIGYWTHDDDCSDKNVTPTDSAYGFYGYHVATPDEVLGLLADKNNCFIATATYGSASESHVQTLRVFRDQFLMRWFGGRQFVRAYYNYGPYAAQWLSNHPEFKPVARVLLTPVWAIANLSLALGEYGLWILMASLFGGLIVFHFSKSSSQKISASKILFLSFISTVLIGLVFFSVTARAQTGPDPIAEEPETAPNEYPYTSEPENETGNESATESTGKTKDELADDLQAPRKKKKAAEAKAQDEKKPRVSKRKPLPVPSAAARAKGLMKITKKGEYIYKTEKTPQSRATSIRITMFSPPNLKSGSATFQEIYGKEARAMLLFDYEWQFFNSLGILGFKLGSGFYSTNGNGRFKSGAGQAEEVYTFLLFPNNASLIYRMKYFDRQPIVPYGDVGLDYYSIAEVRDDGQKPRFGGSGGIHIAGGLALMLDYLSPARMMDLDNDYGINHVYLTGEYRIVKSFGKFDFSDNTLSAGFTIEY